MLLVSLLWASLTTVLAIPQRTPSPGPSELGCSDRPSPPSRECAAAVAALPSDKGDRYPDGSYLFVKPTGNQPSYVDSAHTLPLAPTRHTCKVVIDLDVPSNYHEAFLTERFSWRHIQDKAKELLTTCVDQLHKTGHISNLGRQGILRISIRNIRYGIDTPEIGPSNSTNFGNLTLPLGPEQPSFDTSATF